MRSPEDLRLADELERRAREHADTAERLFEAAALVRGEKHTHRSEVTGEERPPLPPSPASLALAARSYVSEAEYIQTLESRGFDWTWTAESLMSQLLGAGKAVASLDAVRTALGRLEKKGVVVRIRHGQYQLARPDAALHGIEEGDRSLGLS